MKKTMNASCERVQWINKITLAVILLNIISNVIVVGCLKNGVYEFGSLPVYTYGGFFESAVYIIYAVSLFKLTHKLTEKVPFKTIALYILQFISIGYYWFYIVLEVYSRSIFSFKDKIIDFELIFTLIMRLSVCIALFILIFVILPRLIKSNLKKERN